MAGIAGVRYYPETSSGQNRFVAPHLVTEHRSYKMCIYGEGAVGKTCLIRRYVDNSFDEKYLMTIGTNISKKKVILIHPQQKDVGVEVSLQIWDIMGQMGFSDLLKKKHFEGAKGAIGVCDITRRSTLEDLEFWTDSLLQTVGKIPVIFLANKCDLANQHKFGEKELSALAQKYGAVWGFTSARTGENVEKTFNVLAQAMVMTTGK
jgi:small GTP-binding protein